MGSDILQIILLANVFLLGIAVTLAVRHFFNHSPKNHAPQSLSDETRQELAQAMRKEFTSALESSSASLKNDLTSTSKELNRLLATFGTDILNEEMKLFRDNLESIRKKTALETSTTHGQIAAHQAELEMDLAKRRSELQSQIEQRQHTLEKTVLDLQTSIEQSVKTRQTTFAQSLEKREASLNMELDAEVAKERALLIQQIDTKLGDAMASFLLNSLGSNVDLGAQGPYLMKLLETHKEELKQEVSSE
ncbi:MAG: hypothetical protein ABIQ64_04120 [Candidatus Saccharimonadales bacterium]